MNTPKTKPYLLALALGVSLLAGVLVSPAAQAACDTSKGIMGGANCAQEGTDMVDKDLQGDIFTTIVNTFLFIVGAVAVVMLIFGGFKYVTSGGDANSVTAAKNTIMYAVIGIIVAMLSYAILNYVVTTLGGSTNSTPVNFGGGDGLNE